MTLQKTQQSGDQDPRFSLNEEDLERLKDFVGQKVSQFLNETKQGDCVLVSRGRVVPDGSTVSRRLLTRSLEFQSRRTDNFLIVVYLDFRDTPLCALLSQ